MTVRRPLSLAVLSALLGCQVSPEGTAPVVLRAPDDWLTTVSGRITAEDRAIQTMDGVFVARLGADERATFAPDGVSLGDRLTLRTTSWGRGSGTATAASRPRFGACTDDVDATGRCIRRLEYDRGGLVEWWIGRGDGLEQGWTVPSAPPGGGPLRFRVAVEGAGRIVGTAGGARVATNDGRSLQIGGVAAWDADGDALPARLRVEPDAVVVEVDDAGATWPVEVDPVYTDPVWNAVLPGIGTPTEAGDLDGDGFDEVVLVAGERGYPNIRPAAFEVYRGGPAGPNPTSPWVRFDCPAHSCTLASPADVNGDGFEDLVGTAHGVYDGTGDVVVWLGAASGPDGAVDTTLAIGTAVAAVTLDVNGDGFDDVAVARSDEAVDLFLGGPAGLATVPDATLTSGTPGDGFGTSVVGADVDGDGLADLVVGAPWSGAEGRVDTYAGGPGGLSAAPVSTLVGAAAGEALGVGLIDAGDLNGDGSADVVIRSWGVQGVSVHLGGPTGLSATPNVGWPSGTAADLGDVDGDGFDDLYVEDESVWPIARDIHHGSLTGPDPVGAPWVPLSAHRAGDPNGDGVGDVLAIDGASVTAGVYFGARPGGPDQTADVAWGPPEARPQFGKGVAAAGDVNDDGFDDVLVANPSTADGLGRVYVYHGSADGPALGAATVLVGTEVGAGFGTAVSGAGDVDQDGFDDVVVGSPTAGPSDEGGVSWFRGSSTGLHPSADWTWLATPNTRAGSSVAGVGDVNQDGATDVVVGAPSVMDPITWVAVGQVYVFHGGPGGFGAAPDTTLTGTNGSVLGMGFGTTLAAAGDTNDDGFDDLAVGGPEVNQPDSHAEVWVFLGSPSGLSTVPAFDYVAAAGSRLGASVSPAGDVNQDGFDDLLVAAPGSGEVLLFAGSASGLDPAPATTWTGDPADGFGAAIAGVGDVDADGFADLAIGSTTAARGIVEIYPGTPSGALLAPSTVLDPGLGGFGASLAPAGDVNADGFADLLVGHPAVSEASVYLGQPWTDGDSDGVAAGIDCDDDDNTVGLPPTRYQDRDGDGLGSPDARLVCPGVTGWSDTSDDCDDRNASVGGPTLRYIDADGDGWGSTLQGPACAGTPGFVDDDTDCDDTRIEVSPGGVEVCDPNDLDEDCYGGADDLDPNGAMGATALHVDADFDGYGGPTTAYRCDPGPGYAVLADDCDDTDDAVHPGATEVCDPDDVDEDCNHAADEADGLGDPWYADDDGDGFGDPDDAALACDAPAGHVTDATDCDDAHDDTYPGASDRPGDGLDQDCSGADAEPIDTGTPSDTGAPTDTEPTPTDDTDAGGEKGGGGCGCASGPAGAPAGLVAVLSAGLVGRRRRRVAGSARTFAPTCSV